MFVTLLADGIEEDGGGDGGGFPSGQSPLASGRLPSAQTWPCSGPPMASSVLFEVNCSSEGTLMDGVDSLIS